MVFILCFTLDAACLFCRVDKEYILKTAITLFEKLMKTRISSPSEAENVPFADFFDVLVNISSAVGAKGHLMLLEYVKNWIGQRYFISICCR